ncbi:MAG TPA: hypothetical protein DEA90_13835 [Opitutae bacterium]|nr:hypothetical protein [Puniceicoccaceae bacterium]HBR95236.1 hypothetical protein [Opitutae bacterium]|tara:strand:- start:4947 stop:5327 length:381 start_codon:yes stop_codon:yes gene_type:complete
MTLKPDGHAITKLMKISIQAKSSSGDHSYTVDFIKEGELLSVFCNCPAGALGKLCKHKLQLLSGDNSMLHSDGDIEKLNELQAWVRASTFPNLQLKLSELESEIASLKLKIKKEKKNIEKKIKEGF